jgi:PAS domain S-box-containing protein
MDTFLFKRRGTGAQNIRDKLVIVEALIFVLPFLTLSYIVYQGNYYFEFSHLILFSVILVLILAGLIILRQIFDRISIVATSLKKIESGDGVTIDIEKDFTELHDISASFSNLVQKLEQTAGELSQKTFELLTIKELAEHAKKKLSIDALMDLLLSKSMEVTGAQIGSVFMVEVAPRHKSLVVMGPQNGSASIDESAFYRIRVVAAKGHDKELEKGSYISIDSSVVKPVLLERKALLVQDIEKDPRTLKSNDPQYGPPSFMSMPIFIGNSLAAVMNLAHKATGKVFDSDDEQMLSIMFGEVSFALENAMLHSKIDEELQKSKKYTLKMEQEIEERRRTERALAESEKKYRILVENSSDIVFTANPKGNFTYVNPVAERITGFPRSELIGKHYLSFVRPDFHEEIDALYRKQFYEKIPNIYFEFPIITRDGTTKWIGQNVQLIKDNEKIMGFQSVARDITERKRAEEALRESEEKYRLVVENAREAILIVQDGKIVFANQATSEIGVYSEGELTSVFVTEFIHPDDRNMVVQQHTRRLAGEEVSPYVCRVIRRDGTVRWVEITGVLISWKERPATLNFLTDVTDRKRAEDTLKESEMKYRSLAASIDSMYLVDRDCTYLFMNEGYRRRLGLPFKEIIGRRYSDFYSEKDAQEFAKYVREVCETGKPITREHRSERNGRYFLRTFSPAIDRSAAEEISKVVIVSKDITELKRAERELQKARDLLIQSEKLSSIGRLSTGIAHEVLNPVNIISMELQLLLTMENLPPEATEELAICKDQLNRIVTIAENLTQFARIPTKPMVKCDINILIDRVLNIYSSQLKIKGVATVVQYQSDLPALFIDTEKMEQVILNLVTNAIDFMEGREKKALRITTGKGFPDTIHDYLKITVADTGTGIREEDMPKIFDPFFTTKEPGKGTGLGLYISYGIIQDHGGRIRAENNESGGATFFIELPVIGDTDHRVSQDKGVR